MFNIIVFDKAISDLMRSGEVAKAEQRLLETYSELKAANRTIDLWFGTSRLAHYYAMPESEDLKKAEAFFL